MKELSSEEYNLVVWNDADTQSNTYVPVCQMIETIRMARHSTSVIL